MSFNSNPGRLIVPAGDGVAVDVAAGQTMTLTTVTGGQAADFFAFDANDLSDWLSPMHTWTWTRQMAPFAGQLFLSRRRRPMLRFVSDTADGRHDMLFAACDQDRYEQLGFSGYHRSCSENLINAMASHLGHTIDVVPQPVNFFTHTEVDKHHRLLSHENRTTPGDHVVLEALIDLVCVVSSCPYDLDLDDWPTNSPNGVTDLEVSVS
jgi:uncharacterized protein YcgI (DUF1989 family)